MIKANELRIGNKLIYGINPDPAQNIIVTVKTIGEDGINHQIIEDHPDEGTMQFVEKFEYEYLSGIPITPEILINKFRAEQLEVIFGQPQYEISHPAISDKPDLFIVEEKDDGGYSYFGSEWTHGKSNHFVHELQNLFFALTGEELNYQP